MGNHIQPGGSFFILVIAGTRMIATTGTRWAIGPVEEEPVQNKAERGSTLDLLTAFAEFDKHQADK